MRKSTALVALTVVTAALLSLPAAASAALLHVDKTTTFTVKGGTTALSTSAGETYKCQEVSGSGSFSTTTAGTLTLKFGPTCETSSSIFGPVHCNSAGAATGIIETTQLGFHLITIDPGGVGAQGVLITPNPTTKVFSHYDCLNSKTIEGPGIIGTLTTPKCGEASMTATLAFQSTAHGVQKHTLFTGFSFQLTSGGNNFATAMLWTFTFPEKRTLICT